MHKLFQIIFVLLITVFTSLPVIANNSTIPSVVNIPAEELKKMIDDHASFILVDTRSKEEFSAGHISGAINIVPEDVNSKTLAKLSEDMQAKLIFYDGGGESRSGNIAASKAIGAGYGYVYLYSKGFADWQQHGYEIIK